MRILQVGFQPLKLVLCFWPDLTFILALIVLEGVQRNNAQLISYIYLVVATVQECWFDCACILFIGWVVVEPKVMHERVKLSLIVLQRS